MARSSTSKVCMGFSTIKMLMIGIPDQFNHCQTRHCDWLDPIPSPLPVNPITRSTIDRIIPSMKWILNFANREMKLGSKWDKVQCMHNIHKTTQLNSLLSLHSSFNSPRPYCHRRHHRLAGQYLNGLIDSPMKSRSVKIIKQKLWSGEGARILTRL